MSPVKDRLHEMQQIQNGGKNVCLVIDATNDDTTINKTFQNAEFIRENIEIINANTARANNILKNNVIKISKNLQDELDSTFTTTTSTAYKINNSLKEFENELKKINNESSAEFRIRKIQYTALKKEFREAMKENSGCLEFHKNSRKELLKKSLKAARKEATEEELEVLLEENKLDVFTDNHLIVAEEARLQLMDIEERHQELLKIERHLNEVLDLFIKIATLVEEQQESINRVEYHADLATDFVDHGTKDLQKTVKKKKSYTKKKIGIILVAAAVLAVIIIIIIIK